VEALVAWTEITRRKYRRDGLRYASDMTDEEWTVIAPRLPPAAQRGRPRETNLRDDAAQTGKTYFILQIHELNQSIDNRVSLETADHHISGHHRVITEK
jgi:transposase